MDLEGEDGRKMRLVEMPHLGSMSYLYGLMERGQRKEGEEREVGWSCGSRVGRTTLAGGEVGERVVMRWSVRGGREEGGESDTSWVLGGSRRDSVVGTTRLPSVGIACGAG